MLFAFVRAAAFGCLLVVFPMCSITAGEPQPQNVGATDNDPQAEAIKALIKKLNAPDTLQREDAEQELLKIGQAALPIIKEALKSPEPEIVARAQRLVTKLSTLAAKPVSSYAEVMPATSVFFLEAPRARETLDQMKNTPIGKFWDLPVVQKYYKGHRDGELPNSQKMLDAIREIPKLLSGKALLSLGAPETAEAAELEPPLLYVLESKQPQALEPQVRAVFEGMSDPPKSTRKYGPFTVEEHITAQTVFGQESIIHSLTMVGIETFLGNLLKRPEKTLSPLLEDIRAALPGYDFVLHLSSDGFKQLSDAAQLIDDDQIKLWDTLGFVSGSRWQSVLKLNQDGFEEVDRLTFGGGPKNEGLFGVLSKMAAAMPAPVQPGQPQALDLIPWQSALLFSFQGDTSRNASALAKALIAWDECTAPITAVQAPMPVKPALPKEPQKGKDLTAPPVADARELAKEALKAATENKTPKADAPADAAKPVVPHLHLARFEAIGISLEQLFEQVDGPVQVALFLQQIEGEKAPDSIPISPLYAVLLKNPKPVEQALEAASVEPNARFRKEILNGGVHYVELKGSPDDRPGFWLKDRYLAYSSERDLLDLAGQALQHKTSTERMADRQSYKQAWVKKALSQDALLTVFGEADQVFEMPYKLARIGWEDDPQNAWPNYNEIKPLLIGKPLNAQFKAFPGGIQITGQTPLSLLGSFEAFRRPMKEAGY